MHLMTRWTQVRINYIYIKYVFNALLGRNYEKFNPVIMSFHAFLWVSRPLHTHIHISY